VLIVKREAFSFEYVIVLLLLLVDHGASCATVATAFRTINYVNTGLFASLAAAFSLNVFLVLFVIFEECSHLDFVAIKAVLMLNKENQRIEKSRQIFCS